MIPFILLATLALAAAAVVGWLLAVRAGHRSNGPLTAELARTEARLAEATERANAQGQELANAREANATLREQLTAARTETGAGRQALATAEATNTSTHAALTDALAQQAALRAEIVHLRERLDADSASGRAREGRAVAEVQRVLAPLMERERLGAELSRMDMGRGTRGELPRMMDAIARIGSFSSVVLSDDLGLPLAVNTGSEDGDEIAGLWSMLIGLADRIARSGAPVPTAVVVHDAANQTSVHRLFSSAGSRFLLTAVSRGRALPPETLDPALTKLERVLAGSALAAV